MTPANEREVELVREALRRAAGEILDGVDSKECQVNTILRHKAGRILHLADSVKVEKCPCGFSIEGCWREQCLAYEQNAAGQELPAGQQQRLPFERHGRQIPGRDAGQAESVQQPAPAAPASEPYYMIEKTIEGRAHWWIADHSEATHWDDLKRWTTDPFKARRYETAHEAEYVMGVQMRMAGCVVTEHLDCPSPPASEQATGGAAAEAMAALWEAVKLVRIAILKQSAAAPLPAATVRRKAARPLVERPNARYGDGDDD